MACLRYVSCQEIKSQSLNINKLQKLFADIFSKVERLDRKNLIATIVTLTGKVKRTAERYIDNGLKAGIIKLNRANNIVLSIKEEVEEEDDDMLF